MLDEYLKTTEPGFYRILHNSLTPQRRKQFYDVIDRYYIEFETMINTGHNPEQTYLIIVKYLEDHPEEWEEIKEMIKKQIQR